MDDVMYGLGSIALVFIGLLVVYSKLRSRRRRAIEKLEDGPDLEHLEFWN